MWEAKARWMCIAKKKKGLALSVWENLCLATGKETSTESNAGWFPHTWKPYDKSNSNKELGKGGIRTRILVVIKMWDSPSYTEHSCNREL